MKKFLLNAALLLLAATTATAAPTWTDKVEKDVSHENVIIEPVHVVFNYELIANDDNTLTANLTIDGLQLIPGAVPPQFNYGHGYPTMDKTGDNSFTYTTSQTFEPGHSFNEFFFYMPFQSGGVVRTDIPGYTYGASNEAATTEPSISARVENITTNSAEIAYEVSLPEGFEGAEVEVLLDGNATTESPILLEGLEGGRSYSHTLVARATLGGESVESKAAEVTFTTPRPAGQSSHWYGYRNSALPKTQVVSVETPFTLEYELVSNADNTLTIIATIDGNLSTAIGLVPSDVNIGGEIVGKWDHMNNNRFEATTVKTFTDEEQVVVELHWIYAGLDHCERIDDFFFGRSNQRPEIDYKPALSAKASSITAESAVIAWEVVLPVAIADAEVSISIDGGEFITEKPYTLSGLAADSPYSLTIVAKAVKDGKEYLSEPFALEFRTTAVGQSAVSYWQIIDKKLENAWVEGEDSDMRHAFPISVKVEIVHNTDKTATFNIETQAYKVVGFVPFIICDPLGIGQSNMAFVENGKYSYTTPADKTFNDGQALGNTYLRFLFNGTQCDLTMQNIVFGESESNVAVDWGEAASIEMSVGATILKTETPYTIDAFVRDTNGHYLHGIEPVLERGDKDEAQIDFNGMAVTAARKGRSTVRAYIPESNVSSEFELNFNATASSTNVVTREPQGNEQYTMLFEATENPENPQGAFLEDRGQQLIWNNFDDAKGAAGDYELLVDLGRYCVIHAVEIVWEGACAKEFTLNLHIRKDSPWYEGADRANAPRRAPASGSIDRSAIGAEPVFSHTVSDNALVAGGFVTNTAEVGGVNARYISLKPTTAASVYGVKIAHLNVLGDENEFNADGTPTGVTDVTVDSTADATVDVYSLSGVCLRRGVGSAEATAGLAPGLYIVGERKVMVK